MTEHLVKATQSGLVKDGRTTPKLNQILRILKAQTGHDFSSYKLNTICRRIERQMQTHYIEDLNDYIHFLRLHPHEISNLLKDLLIGVTNFFRDKEAFDALKDQIILKLQKNKSENTTFRVWIPGCSTGEEVYSIAILVWECMEEKNLFREVQIFGTDVDSAAIDIARTGVYSANKCFEITPERLKKYFTKEHNNHRINKQIRKMVIFGAQNVINDPAFSKLDMICCRNLLIYFNTKIQKKLFPLFHYSLKPKGILFLGNSESISESVDLFRLLVKKWKIFERKDVITFPYSVLDFPSTSSNKKANLFPVINFQKVNEDKSKHYSNIKKFLLTTYVPACVATDTKGTICFINGKTSPYFDINLQDNANFFDLLPTNLHSSLRKSFIKALNTFKEVIISNVLIKLADPKWIVDIRIIPLLDIEPILVLIVFEDKFTKKQSEIIQTTYSSTQKMGKKILELERELQYSKENLHTTIEELQSNNEELQSTNEELQSINEEIVTSKEELQSLNEELGFANTELHNQIEQLAITNEDISNLFNSTEIAALFLDDQMKIKRFTPKIQDIMHLINADVGRPFEHFATNLRYDHLVKNAWQVIKTLKPKIFNAQSHFDCWYQIKILPYRTLSNVIDGVVITFINVTHDKITEKLVN